VLQQEAQLFEEFKLARMSVLDDGFTNYYIGADYIAWPVAVGTMGDDVLKLVHEYTFGSESRNLLASLSIPLSWVAVKEWSESVLALQWRQARSASPLSHQWHHPHSVHDDCRRYPYQSVHIPWLNTLRLRSLFHGIGRLLVNPLYPRRSRVQLAATGSLLVQFLKYPVWWWLA